MTIERREHKSNGERNTYLFKVIEACGISVKDFITGYLSVLQPYSLEYFQGSKVLGKNNIWVKLN